jgi:glycosyltransferase involved in cell wall biosynthesis
VPTISIVTVVKDDAEGLQRTLASIASQGEQDAELIVVDGSTPSLKLERALPLAVQVIAEPPSGIYPAMNSGLFAAQGRYTYFLNAGDVFADSHVLDRTITGLREANFPLWAFGAVRFYNASGELLTEPDWSYPAERKRLFARGRFPAHQGFIACTETMRNLNGFDTSYRITADYAMMLQLSRMADPIRWNWPIAEFRQGGASSQHWRQALREFHRARVTVFAPSGFARLQEHADTAIHSVHVTGAHLIASMRR